MADCHFAYDMASDTSILFIPPLDPDEVVWCGLPVGVDDALRRYDVDQVKTTDEVNATLAHLARAGADTVYALAGQVSDRITFLDFAAKDFAALKPAIEAARVVKDEYEVAMIRKANHISGLAHRVVLDRARPGAAANERELEAAFLERCVAHGAKEMAYHPILAAGKAAATLHYVDNDAPLAGKQNLLIDAGAEWDNYASDIVSRPLCPTPRAPAPGLDAAQPGSPRPLADRPLLRSRRAPFPCRGNSPRSRATSTTSSTRCSATAPP